MRYVIKRRLQKPSKRICSAQNFARHANIAVVLVCFLAALSAKAQTLTVSPQRPAPGDTLLITYDARGGKFEKDTLKLFTALVFNGLISDNKKIPLAKTGQVYRAIVPTDSSTLAVAFGFGQNKKWDLTPPQGHIYAFYKNGNIVEGARLVIADLYTNATGKALYGFDNQYQHVAMLLKEELDRFPTGTYYTKTLEKYCQSILNVDPVAGKKEVLGYIAKLNQKKKATDLDYYQKYVLYNILTMSEQAESSIDSIIQKFPNSPIIFAKRYKNALTPRSAGDMESIGNKLIVDYGMDENSSFKSFKSSVYATIALAYLKESNFDKYFYYLLKTEMGVRSFTLANSVDFLIARKSATAEAEKVAVWNISMTDTLVAANKTEKKPEFILNRLYEGESALGQINYHQGKFDDAYLHLKRAYAEMKIPSSETGFYYALTLLKKGEAEKATEILETVIKSGKIENEVISAYQEAFLMAGGNAENCQKKIEQLLFDAKEARHNNLAKMMLSQPAPKFSLMDQNGEKVSLDDFKGKIVVLDFWATWCIPCLQAFPGMQKVINKYQNDQDVVFLFVNTAEKFNKARRSDIISYLNKNKFNFRVLLDEKLAGQTEYQVQSQYNASSIPLKVVIDRSGNIRFRSVGYLGNDEKVVEEISDFIEMLK